MLTYIRCGHDGKSSVSHTADAFSPNLAPYRDTVQFSCLQEGREIIYAYEKQSFSKSYELLYSPQLWTVLCVAEGDFFCGKEVLGAGDFVIIPPALHVTLRSETSSTVFYRCTTNDEVPINILSICGYRAQEISKGHTECLRPIIEIFENTLYHLPTNQNERMYFISAFTTLFSLLPNTKNDDGLSMESEQLFSRCLSHIDHMYGNVSANDVAKRCFVSRRCLHAMFKKYRNISPSQYLLSVRMKTADHFLETTDFSVAHIAELTGYSDYNHFTRAYKKYFGTLPSKRRKLTAAQLLASDRKEKI